MKAGVWRVRSGIVALAMTIGLATAGCAQVDETPTAEGQTSGVEASSAPAEIRLQMPPRIMALYLAGDRTINQATRCEVIDWVAAAPQGWPEPSVRSAERYVDICVLGSEGVTPDHVAQSLAGETFAFDVSDGVLAIYARSNDVQVIACCTPQTELERIGDGPYWVKRLRISDSQRAMVSLSLIRPGAPPAFIAWRGPDAPPAPEEVPIGKLRGQMISREIASKALGETRKLRIYLPPQYEAGEAWPTLFLTDGGAAEFAGLVETMIEAGMIEPIVIVSAASGKDGVVGELPTQYGDDLRSADYLRRWPQGGDRFDRQMEFFASELVAWAQREYGVSPDRARRAVAGKSSGGVFSFWAGVMRPDAFAHAVPMSPGYLILEEGDLGGGASRAAFHVSGGMYEPGFIVAARNAEAQLRAAGYDVTARYYTAGHFHDQWVVALREALLEIFPAE